MKILTGYTGKEIEEFKDLSKIPFSVTELIKPTLFQSDFPHLYSKVTHIGFDEWKFLTDLTDYHNGNAKFSEQYYYVKLIDCDRGYLNYKSVFKKYLVNNINNSVNYKTKFTMPEIKAINENYVPFAVPIDEVEDDE